MQWFATFAKLGGASLPSPGNPALAIDGIDAWPVFESFVSAKPVAPTRKEVLIAGLRHTSAVCPAGALEPWLSVASLVLADNILRVGAYKYVVGGDRKGWAGGFCRDCLLGTGGGWLEPPSDKTNNTNLW